MHIIVGNASDNCRLSRFVRDFYETYRRVIAHAGECQPQLPALVRWRPWNIFTNARSEHCSRGRYRGSASAEPKPLRSTARTDIAAVGTGWAPCGKPRIQERIQAQPAIDLELQRSLCEFGAWKLKGITTLVDNQL